MTFDGDSGDTTDDAQAALDTHPDPTPPRVTLARTTLLDYMPDRLFEEMVVVTQALIERRFATMQRLTSVASKEVNINPFLMLAMAPAYNIFTPFEVAEYAQNAKMPHGDATAFGRFVEERIFPIFGSARPPEKVSATIDNAQSRLFSSIDAELNVEGTRYLATYKSGPWTINQSHAHEMIANFPQIHEQTGCDIVIGITYGSRDRVNNKPRYVERETGPFVHTLVGQDLWEFITGVRDAHLSAFHAIKEAQRRFAASRGGKSFHEHMIEARLKLAESFRTTFDLDGSDNDMWEEIFRGSF
jgi:hypothetical protein